jgi:hypothetical protein
MVIEFRAPVRSRSGDKPVFLDARTPGTSASASAGWLNQAGLAFGGIVRL